MLSDIQALQREFDITRGFDFREFWHDFQNRSLTAEASGTSLSDLWLLQFTALALCGEAGELANAVKKASRAEMLKEEPKPHIAQARLELADVFAYLLKTANILGDDLETRYLEVVCGNALRFPVRQDKGGVIVSLAGPSGAGKSTIAHHLRSHNLGVEVYVEESQRNSFLPDVERGAESQATYESQEWFISQQEKFIRGLVKGQAGVLDQDPAGIVLVYTRMFHDLKRLNQSEYQSSLWRLAQLEIELGQSQRRRFIIYLDAPAKILYQRIQEREGKKVFHESWFHDLRQKFEEVFAGLPNCTRIRTDELSETEVTEVVASILRDILKVDRK